MPIAETQLDTWARQGSITQSSDTYATIRRSLESSSTGFADKDYKIFLQGSYGNDTNIYSESDVDVLIRLDSMYFYDISRLSADDQVAFNTYSGGSATYGYLDFKRDVVAALQKSFGADVTVGKKAIEVAESGSRRKVDVIAAAQFRRYRSYSLYNTQDYVSGICFFNDSAERIVNYPVQHSVNLTAKHQASALWLKPTIRILKNLRRRMQADGAIAAGLAPSYFLEGLLYNVPNEMFGVSYEDAVVKSLNWILDADRSTFIVANEEYYLVRDVPHVCWRPSDCDAFLTAVVQYWKDWK
jgi:hypothetical protein